MSVTLTCRKHPKYMAKRPPTAQCDACRDIWHLVEEKRELPETWAFEIEAK
jgi:hypothetical protein